MNYGAAGVGYGFYRLAVSEGSAAMLSTADLWAMTALNVSEHPLAFRDRDGNLGSDTVGPATPFHRVSGIHLVRCLISRALGDARDASMALAAYLRATKHPFRSPDLTLGHGGVLLGDALLADALDREPDVEGSEKLLARGSRLHDEVTDYLDSAGPIGEGGEQFLGVAHGWAGYLYAILAWSAVSDTPPPTQIETYLEQIRSTAMEVGEGLRWPRWPDSDDPRVLGGSMAGWCHGSAGYAMLFVLAARVLGNDRWLSVAKRAARDAWADSGELFTLCCGLVGRAYAQLALYRATGDGDWMDRARDLAGRLTRIPWNQAEGWGLYKGVAGPAVLYRDLQAPEEARMPFFELEGWSEGGEAATSLVSNG